MRKLFGKSTPRGRVSHLTACITRQVNWPLLSRNTASEAYGLILRSSVSSQASCDWVH